MISRPIHSRILVAACLLTAGASVSCEKSAPAAKQEEKPAAELPLSELAQADSPVLEILPGHTWSYQVTVENPYDTRIEKSLKGSFVRTRTYLGKVNPGEGHPMTDCFEVQAKGAKTQREYVDIQPNEIQLRGQVDVEADGAQSNFVWLQQPMTFFRAGLDAGDTLPFAVFNQDKDVWRVIRVIGREDLTVPAGTFKTVRLQMFGKDGNVGLRRTYWFAPGVGIIREEKVREVDEKPVFRETDELVSSTPGKNA
ncbi:hypothetical protein JIN85_06805 [Luteolibacter pohnpeiensis]|uniref:DUF3108 domain-containing protein n=1 Tax=Luteolibacter pohnpeiensis TaxID=454153 RepID=A0A934S2T0_9BACT|nr:hypothetical protein [Luteolibacter pohnpeiensis]MBK1882115.1 hypothetical protein [Luteolibacter pohnpeiensis]